MRIKIKGTENGVPKKYTYNLLDRYDKTTETISMARTTGYTCTAAANLLLDGAFSKYGVNPPEYLGTGEGNLAYILKHLEERGVKYSAEVE